MTILQNFLLCKAFGEMALQFDSYMRVVRGKCHEGQPQEGGRARENKVGSNVAEAEEKFTHNLKFLAFAFC